LWLQARIATRSAPISLDRTQSTDAAACTPPDPQAADYVRGKRVSLIDSVVRLILSEKRPRLIRTQCDRSAKPPAGHTWGLCTNDPS